MVASGMVLGIDKRATKVPLSSFTVALSSNLQHSLRNKRLQEMVEEIQSASGANLVMTMTNFKRSCM